MRLNVIPGFLRCKESLRVMCVTAGVLLQLEQVAELLTAEMPLHIFLFIHHTTAQGFLVSLPLEDLLFYCSCL